MEMVHSGMRSAVVSGGCGEFMVVHSWSGPQSSFLEVME